MTTATKQELTKKLYDLRVAVDGKRFIECPEEFKDIESTKVKLAALEKK